MSHQELFPKLITTPLNKTPIYSGWPYFILIVAAFLVSTSKLASQSLPEEPESITFEDLLKEASKGVTLDRCMSETEEKKSDNQCRLKQ